MNNCPNFNKIKDEPEQSHDSECNEEERRKTIIVKFLFPDAEVIENVI